MCPESVNQVQCNDIGCGYLRSAGENGLKFIRSRPCVKTYGELSDGFPVCVGVGKECNSVTVVQCVHRWSNERG